MLSLLFILVVVGVLLWLVTTKIPMDPTIKGIIYVVAIIGVLVYVGGALGVFNGWPQACRLR